MKTAPTTAPAPYRASVGAVIDSVKQSVVAEAHDRWKKPTTARDNDTESSSGALMKERIDGNTVTPGRTQAAQKFETAKEELDEIERKHSNRQQHNNGLVNNHGRLTSRLDSAQIKLQGVSTIAATDLQAIAGSLVGKDWFHTPEPWLDTDIGIANAFGSVLAAKAAIPYLEKAVAGIKGEIQAIEAELADLAAKGLFNMSALTERTSTPGQMLESERRQYVAQGARLS